MSNGGPSLLVVDDSVTSRTLLCGQLERQGYQVTGAASGRQALELLQSQSFDLVLLDIEMPEMNGLEVLINLRQTHALTELPVIMVTGRDQTGDMVATLQLGANDYVTKPFNIPVILARIQTQLAVKEAGAPAPAAAGSVGAALSRPSGLVRRLGGSASGTRTNTGAASQATTATPPSGPAPPAGRPYVDGYEVLGELGRGGMGVVYKARHLRMNRLVALKVIDSNYLRHPDAVQRFYQEVQAAAQLGHPNIVMAYDAGQGGSVRRSCSRPPPAPARS
jgi:CheY-like chemotaxis protein